MDKNIGVNIQPKEAVQPFLKNRLILGIVTLSGLILAVVVVIWLSLAWRPDVTQMPPDSGFYAYIGKAILHGQIPYRDVWDDKPPLGYYLNAVALFIFGQTPWGVWWSSVIWITGCVLLLFMVTRKLFGGITAGVTSAVFLIALMNPEIFQGGNLMEVYALAPQIGIIGITSLYFNRPSKSWLSVLAGALTAAAYLIKQPTIVLGCTSILIMVVSQVSERKIRDAFLTGVRFVLGFVSLVGLVALYWLAISAFRYFLDGAILQGFSFIGGGESRIKEFFFYTLVNVLMNLFVGRLYLIALLAGGIFLLEKLYRNWLKPILKEHLSWLEWCLVLALSLLPVVFNLIWPGRYRITIVIITILALGVLFLIRFYRLREKPVEQQVFNPSEWTWLAAIVALPLEVLMASLGGRYFGHYFISMIPAVCLAIAYPVWRLVSAMREIFSKKERRLHSVGYFIPVILTFFWGVSSLAHVLPSATYTNHITGIFKGQNAPNLLDNYILQTTQPKDEVLVWHIHLGINFVTDRKAPSRFLFPLNLFIPPTEANTRLEEYVNDLEANPPELILIQNVSSLALPFVDTPIDLQCKTYCTPEFVKALEVPHIRQQWLRFQDFFTSNYVLDTRIYDWKVYRRLP